MPSPFVLRDSNANLLLLSGTSISCDLTPNSRAHQDKYPMPALHTYDLSSPLDLVPDHSTLQDQGAQASTSTVVRRARRQNYEYRQYGMVAGLHSRQIASSLGGGDASSESLMKRSTLEPNHTQSVTLGVIAA